VDKLLQRETLRNGGVSSPLCWEVPVNRDREAIEARAAEVELPAVLKPRTGNGGQYTMPVADAVDLVRSIALLPPQAGVETGMFVEQYLPSLPTRASEHFGEYVSVESLVADGEISHVAVM
jgi:biotin carboxylase